MLRQVGSSCPWKSENSYSEESQCVSIVYIADCSDQAMTDEDLSSEHSEQGMWVESLYM